MTKKLPRWLRQYMTTSDLRETQRLIQSIEKTTSIELVPLVVRSSLDLRLLRYFVVAIALALTFAIMPLLDQWASWGTSISIKVIYWMVGLCLVALAWWLPSTSTFVRFWFNKGALHELVFKRACFEYFANHLHKADSRTAVLFMYSVLERKAMIIADPSLSKIDVQLWNTAIGKMVSAAKTGSFFEGFREAFEFVADALAKEFPATSVNNNELSDQVIIKW